MLSAIILHRNIRAGWNSLIGGIPRELKQNLCDSSGDCKVRMKERFFYFEKEFKCKKYRDDRDTGRLGGDPDAVRFSDRHRSEFL